ncbi:MAG: hypothetical protein LBG52_05670 [Candidatus Peribacteria bacterium]|nr:hypothetical protein [Candidatus Peribacteria bacterium]
MLNLFPKEEHELITEQKFDKECVAQLLRIIEETGAFVIMSSSWRYVPELLESSRKQT